jgi:hypothetical protein
VPVTVATVFSAAGLPPHTRAARAFLRQCAAADAEELYELRRREDGEVVAGLGARHVHLGVPDALFRLRRTPLPASRLVPELVHRYPTFRFDVARGRVSRADGEIVDRLERETRQLAEEIDARLVFAPLGVGQHVDHLLTRQLGERFGDRLVHYADFPYTLTCAPDPQYIARRGLRPVSWTDGVSGKAALISGYRSQVDALFADGEIPAVPETYYLPAWG